MQQTMDALSQNLDFERCSIFLLNNSEELHCVVGKSWHQNEEINKMDLAKESHIFEIGQGVMGRAAENRQIYHCENCKADKNYLSIIQPKIDNRSGSLISMPIMVGEELLGVLTVVYWP